MSFSFNLWVFGMFKKLHNSSNCNRYFIGETKMIFYSKNIPFLLSSPPSSQNNKSTYPLKYEIDRNRKFEIGNKNWNTRMNCFSSSLFKKSF